ncbi:MAG: CsbD family protein [Snowella sp.]|nr:CsbD family protein [Snowella sp.]
MLLIQFLRRFCFNIVVSLFLAMPFLFGVGVADSWAVPMGARSPIFLVSSNPVEALTKGIESNVQEAVGKITGDTKQEAAGHAKGYRADAIKKKAEGKAQEAQGRLAGDHKTTVDGKAKQLQAETIELNDASVLNPEYQPRTLTPQEKKDRKNTEAIKVEAIEPLE